MENKIKNYIKIISTLSFLGGIIIGMLLMFLLIFSQTENIISNILGHISVENINFNINETALIEGLNNTLGSLG